MRIVCINNESFNDNNICDGISIHKIYDVIKEYPQTYELVNDDMIITSYLKIRFITLEEYREGILNNLNIE